MEIVRIGGVTATTTGVREELRREETAADDVVIGAEVTVDAGIGLRATCIVLLSVSIVVISTFVALTAPTIAAVNPLYSLSIKECNFSDCNQTVSP